MTDAGTASDTAALNARWADALVGALVASGVRDAVVSPGSRNTPLVLALAARSERAGQTPAGGSTLRVHSILDERSAAFYALGIARVTGAPVVLSCTSGSAGAHWLPAVIEADHSRLPLVLLTADRPPELHGAGAPQTVHQSDLFGRHVRLHADPGTPTPGPLGWLRTLAARAVDAAAGARPGPVHLNLPFREPLWHAAQPPVPPVDRAPSILRSPAHLDATTVATLATELVRLPHGVITLGPGDSAVCGRARADHLRGLARASRRLARALGWPLLVDAASGARFAPALDPSDVVVTTGDLLTRSEAFSTTPPSAVLRVGQVPTSKPLAAWLATAPADATLLVDPCGDWLDPHHGAGRLLQAEPVALLDALADAVLERSSRPAVSPWLVRWQAAELTALAAIAGTSSAADPAALWSGGIARATLAALPEGALLHVASSLAVRAVDSFSGPAPRAITVTANRGANGIDGTLATALGEASAWPSGPVAVLVGDLAFLHDLGSLLTCPVSADAAPLTLVVMDNRGGGIFDHLPIAQHPTAFESYFVTESAADIPALARAAGAACTTVDDARALRLALAEAVERPGLSVVHARLGRAHDLSTHQAVRDAVAGAIAGGGK